MNDPNDRTAALEEHMSNVVMELAGISGELRELIEIQAGEATTIPLRVTLSDVNNPWPWESKGGMFHALKVDNPSSNLVAVSFNAGGTAAANHGGADELVHANTGRVIVRPFDFVEIGVAPGDLVDLSPWSETLYVTLYARPLQPATYAF